MGISHITALRHIKNRFLVTHNLDYGKRKGAKMGKVIISTGAGGGVGSDDVTASRGDVLSGKTAVTADSNDEAGAGTMPNNGAQSGTLNCGQSKVIPKGYTTGGTVSANSLASQTPGNGNSATQLKNFTGWANGTQYTGNIEDYAGQVITPSPYQQVVGCAWKRMTGNVTVNPVSNLLAQYIKKGVWVGGVLGTFEGYVPSSGDLFYMGTNPSGMVAADPSGGYLGIDSVYMWLAKRGCVNNWMFFRTNNLYDFNTDSRIYMQSATSLKNWFTRIYLDSSILTEVNKAQYNLTVTKESDYLVYATIPNVIRGVRVYLNIEASNSALTNEAKISRVWIA